MMVDPREVKVLEWQGLEPLKGRLWPDLPGSHLLEQFA